MVILVHVNGDTNDLILRYAAGELGEDLTPTTLYVSLVLAHGRSLLVMGDLVFEHTCF